MGLELPQWWRDLSGDGWAAVAAFIALAVSGYQAARRVLERRSRRRHADPRILLAARDDAGSGEAYFELTNEGWCAARDLEVVFHTDPSQREAEPVFISNTRLPFPMPELMPGSRLRVPTVMTISVPSYFDLTLTWNDGRRGRQSARRQVSRP